MTERKPRAGISLFLNNDPTAAEDFFNTPSEDIEMIAGKCFISLINALLSYEPEQFSKAEDELRKLKDKCKEDVGWVESIKSSVFGSSFQLTDPTLFSRLKKQIILADCLVCESLLIFFKQDLTSYVQGGWRLRQAWKVYQHTYRVIRELFENKFGSVGLKESASVDFSSTGESASGDPCPTVKNIPHSSSWYGGYLPSFLSSSPTTEISLDPQMVESLMCEVSFGYGIFQLCVSLLPQHFLRFVNFFGMEGDRQSGLDALKTAKNAETRGPLALLALLWYHTIVRPYLALDGSQVRSGERIASKLLEESKEEFSDSAYFLFFKGKIERMKGNITESVEAFEQTLQKSPQREMQGLCYHEIGWCYLIQLDWKNSYECFENLVDPHKWGALFYQYKIAICRGANSEDPEDVKQRFENLKQELLKSIGSWTFIEQFLARRVKKVRKNPTKDACTLLGIELLYLWNALPSCDSNTVLGILELCETEPMVGLRKLLQGVVHSIRGECDQAEACWSVCLEQRKEILASSDDPNGNDDHISAFCGLELGTLLLKRPEEKERGRQILKETEQKYKGYDFEHKVSVRIPSALRWS